VKDQSRGKMEEVGAQRDDESTEEEEYYFASDWVFL
jgi:hypothetical protein